MVLLKVFANSDRLLTYIVKLPCKKDYTITYNTYYMVFSLFPSHVPCHFRLLSKVRKAYSTSHFHVTDSNSCRIQAKVEPSLSL